MVTDNVDSASSKRFDHANATSKIFDRVHRTGEEVKNDLPNWVERAVKFESWRESINPSTGEPFETVGEWLVASWPLGPGMGSSEFSITYDEFILLCEKRPTLKKLLVESRPKRPGARTDLCDNITEVRKPTHGSTSRAYLEDRLARDFPDHWRDYIDGKYKSARQAAIAAGFLKGPPSPAEACVKAFRKAENRLEALRMILVELEPHEAAWAKDRLGGSR